MMISKLSVVVFALLTIQVTPFPRLNTKGVQDLTRVARKAGGCPYQAKQDETECAHPAKKELKRQTTFDPTAQHVSTTEKHAWVAPRAGDQRGPCPGLNALANHGYLPHNGVADIATTVSAVNTGKFVAVQCATQGCGAAFRYSNIISPCVQIFLGYN